MSKIYIAAPYSARDMVNLCADDLINQGHDIVSTWHRRPAENEDDLSRGEKIALARQLLDDIDAADILLYLHIPDAVSRGGQDVELGYAIKAKKGIAVIGTKDKNLFTSLFEKHKLICL